MAGGERPVWQNLRHLPPFKVVGLVTLAVILAVAALIYLQFHGALTPRTQLTLIAGRSGLVMDQGAKVTYNGVLIGRVADVTAVVRGDRTVAKIVVDIKPRYVSVIPANVDVDIKASTLFGNKYVAFASPPHLTAARVSAHRTIDVSEVTTEFNTLFETVTSIAEKVDPVKLNLTLSAAAEALRGLGGKFGQSLVKGNAILADINPQLPQVRYDLQRLSDLADVYTHAGPDFWDFLDNAVTTASTLSQQQSDLDATLLAATGFAMTGADTFERGGPYLVRGASDLVPTTKLLDYYSPEFFCSIRNIAEVTPDVLAAFGGNSYALDARVAILGAPNPYVYPDNLPRTNARGGPGGAPGCWQKITRDFWPAPYLVMDAGVSIAPYNHFELGSPFLTEYVWGRQVGESTINP